MRVQMRKVSAYTWKGRVDGRACKITHNPFQPLLKFRAHLYADGLDIMAETGVEAAQETHAHAVAALVQGALKVRDDQLTALRVLIRKHDLCGERMRLSYAVIPLHGETHGRR